MRNDHGMSVEYRNRVCGIDPGIGENFEAAARNGHASFRAEKLQAALAAPTSAGLVIRIERSEAWIFIERILRIRSLAVILKSEAAAAGRDRERSLHLHHPLHDVDFVCAQVRHLAAGVIPEPA